MPERDKMMNACSLNVSSYMTERDTTIRPSFMGIGLGSGILLDLVLFADRTNAEPESYRSIVWEMEGLQRFERRVYIFLALCF